MFVQTVRRRRDGVGCLFGVGDGDAAPYDRDATVLTSEVGETRALFAEVTSSDLAGILE